MPLALIAIGTLLLITGIKGNPAQLYALIAADFQGTESTKGYLYWMFAIVVIGAIGYIKGLQPLSRAFMILVVVVLLLHNQGFFSELQKAILPQAGSQQNG